MVRDVVIAGVGTGTGLLNGPDGLRCAVDEDEGAVPLLACDPETRTAPRVARRLFPVVLRPVAVVVRRGVVACDDVA